MNFFYTVILLMLSVSSVRALEIDLPIKTYIVKSGSSGNIEIEIDKDTYNAKYDESMSKFKDLKVPFKVKTSSSFFSLYNLSLIQSSSKCESDFINLNFKLDERDINVGDVVKKISFDAHDGSYSFKNHSLSFIFPIILQKEKSIHCTGSASIFVEAVI